MVAMSQLIDAAVNQKPAGLIVSIPDSSALGPAIQKAVAAGIPVISMNSGSDVSKKLGALLHVGQDEYRRRQGRRREAQGIGRQGRPVRQPGGRQRVARPALQGLRGRLRRQGDGAARLQRSGRDARQGEGGARGRYLRRYHPGARRRHGRRAVARRREGGRQDGQDQGRHLRPVGWVPQGGRRAARRPSPSTSSSTCRAICRWCSWPITPSTA